MEDGRDNPWRQKLGFSDLDALMVSVGTLCTDIGDPKKTTRKMPDSVRSLTKDIKLMAAGSYSNWRHCDSFVERRRLVLFAVRICGSLEVVASAYNVADPNKEQRRKQKYEVLDKFDASAEALEQVRLDICPALESLVHDPSDVRKHHVSANSDAAKGWLQNTQAKLQLILADLYELCHSDSRQTVLWSLGESGSLPVGYHELRNGLLTLEVGRPIVETKKERPPSPKRMLKPPPTKIKKVEEVEDPQLSPSPQPESSAERQTPPVESSRAAWSSSSQREKTIPSVVVETKRQSARQTPPVKANEPKSDLKTSVRSSAPAVKAPRASSSASRASSSRNLLEAESSRATSSQREYRPVDTTTIPSVVEETKPRISESQKRVSEKRVSEKRVSEKRVSEKRVSQNTKETKRDFQDYFEDDDGGYWREDKNDGWWWYLAPGKDDDDDAWERVGDKDMLFFPETASEVNQKSPREAGRETVVRRSKKPGAGIPGLVAADLPLHGPAVSRLAQQLQELRALMFEDATLRSALSGGDFLKLVELFHGLLRKLLTMHAESWEEEESVQKQTKPEHQASQLTEGGGKMKKTRLYNEELLLQAFVQVGFGVVVGEGGSG